ncbi:DUF1513 domain-containing protein [Alteromonas sp. a30]|uniref:DUF1513 domain-containing protein n=1 Tax=Alteromonas sp. a30 TaxID=2730917 RepID=UPI00227EAC82|nr:DUF1513 domain-containing protein [Alteromonas sp. a30]MCY7293991.1 DUF1513 domain-containing protein [Alteromonas sp. a30]
MTVIKGIDRRQFLLGSSSAALVAMMLPSCSANSQQQWMVSSASDNQGKHYVAAVDIDGYLISRVALPARGHDTLALPHKPGHALVFARSPNTFAMEINFITGHITHQFECGNDTYFCGHGALSADGSKLFTSENQLNHNQGMIVVRDTQSYQVLNRFASGGISPHELVMLPNSNTLAVANSGIVSVYGNSNSVDTPASKVTSRHFTQSNLAYIDADSGRVIAKLNAPEAGQSIRHLDVSPEGKVYIGMQYEGDTLKDSHKNQSPKQMSLIYSHQGNEGLKASKASELQMQRIQHQTSSVKVLNNLLAVTCPQSHCITFLHADSLEVIEQQEYQGAAGLTAINNMLVASNREGKLRIYNNKVNLKYATEQTVASLRFDSHMTSIYSA